MSDRHCLVCGVPEFANVCAMCGAEGWTDKTVMQAIVDLLRHG